MKNIYKNNHRIFSVIMLSVLLILLYSCDYYNFSQPQPGGKENIYEFPKEFHGKWIESQDSFQQPVESAISLKQHLGGPINWQDHQAGFLHQEDVYPKNGSTEEDSSCYYIDKNYAMLIIHEKEKIVTGAWPQIGYNGELLYAPFFNTLRKIEYDSLKRPIDTIDNYLFHENKIYEIGVNRFLGKGYTYYRDKDTLVVFKNDTICVDLGQNAFLRKLNQNFYVLNIRNTILGEENPWWRLMILEIKDQNSFAIWECSSKSGELSSMFYEEPSKSDIFYFDCNWSSSELLRLIHEGYFEISSTVIKDERFKK